MKKRARSSSSSSSSPRLAARRVGPASAISAGVCPGRITRAVPTRGRPYIVNQYPSMSRSSISNPSGIVPTKGVMTSNAGSHSALTGYLLASSTAGMRKYGSRFATRSLCSGKSLMSECANIPR